MFSLIKSSITLALLAFIINHAYKWCAENSIGIHYNNVTPGPCRVVPGIECGSEQISVSTNGLAFITNGFHSLTNCNLKYLQGGIFIFDFNNPDKNVTKLQISGDFDKKSFDPHGMDILESGKIIDVYVVNHANKSESIEVFRYDLDNPGKLEYVKTLQHELFVCLNSITLISKDKFYATNSVKFCNSNFPGLVELEILAALKMSNLIFYNDGKVKIMLENEILMNGVTLSKDKTKVFAILALSHQLYVLERNLENDLLQKVNQHDLKFGIDNIFLDKQTGHLYIGTMKSVFCLLQLTSNKTSHCSATGTRVTPKSSDWSEVNVEELLHLDGKNFVSGSSSFVHYKGQYLVGTVFNKLGYCQDRCSL